MYISIMNDLWGDDYDVHKAIKMTFGEEGRLLFQRRKISTHILSPEPPKGKVVITKHINGVISNIQRGDVMEFSLRINPVVSKKTREGRGVRKAVPAYDIERWLNRNFIRNGFVADFTYKSEGFRESVKEGHVISINSLMVNGTMEVLNPDTVRQALVQGIGTAKGLGFGMLHIYDNFIIPETL